VFDNNVMRGMFGHKEEEVNEGWQNALCGVA
jgi:hypothetical protein